MTTWTGPGKLWKILNAEDAKNALKEIMEQGEGRGPLDPDADRSELAHYYRFAEIVHGRRLVRHGNQYAFDGDPIHFDPAGVWPMVDDPGMVPLAPGSKARLLTDRFALTYRALLRSLHRAFNGEPASMAQAVGVMYSLSVVARDLMQTPSGLADGTTAGPSFQTLPADPAAAD